jgi:outer membrane protein assembly factor BamC
MNRRIFYSSLLTLAVASCSTVDNKRAVGDFDYATTPEAKELVIPAGLHKPAKHRDFEVSDKINHKGPVGVDVDVRAPSLVLPVAASSRVIPESEEALIWFDKIIEEKDLLTFIHKAIEDQLAESDISLTAVEGETTTYESDWFHTEVESGWILTSIDVAESMRFKYQLTAKPHGRSVSLKVSLVDYIKTNSDGGSKTMNQIDQQRAEMAMVNEIIGQVDYMYRLEQRDIRLMRANKQMVAIGENPEAEPAYIVEMKLDYLWSNLPLFFEKHGFVITDLNESKKIYFVDFVTPENSIWDSIWGDNTPVVDISDAKYQFVLAEMGEQTALTIYGADGDVLPIETLERIFAVMEPGLSFRDIY